MASTTTRPTPTAELTAVDRATILDGLQLLAIEHHRQAVLAHDEPTAQASIDAEHWTDELAETIASGHHHDLDRRAARTVLTGLELLAAEHQHIAATSPDNATRNEAHARQLSTAALHDRLTEFIQPEHRPQPGIELP